MTKAPRPGAARGRHAHPREDAGSARGSSRQSISLFAPRIVTIRIPVDKIRDVIGPGGKMIRSIIERNRGQDRRRKTTAASTSRRPTAKSAQKAISIIQELTATPELNKDVSRQDSANHRFRCVRRDHARNRRPAPRCRRFANHRVEGRPRRAEGRRTGARQSDQHRSHWEDQAQPEGAAGRNRAAPAPRQVARADGQPRARPVTTNALRRCDALADVRMAVEEHLDELRGVLFSQVLGRKPPHRGHKRKQDSSSV